MKKLKEGDKVTISGGSTLDHNDQPIDVSGMVGTVEDSYAYTRERDGDHMVEVKLDREYGGGKAYVPVQRLSSGRKFFGGLGGFLKRRRS